MARSLTYMIIVTCFFGSVIFLCISWDFVSSIILEYKLMDIPSYYDQESELTKIIQYHPDTVILRAFVMFMIFVTIQPLIL